MNDLQQLEALARYVSSLDATELSAQTQETADAFLRAEILATKTAL